MFRRTLISFIGIASLAFIGTFFFTLWVMGGPSRQLGFEGERRVSHIEEGAEFVRNFIFADGLRGASLISSVHGEWVGLSSTEFAQGNPQWRVVSFAPTRIVVEEPCNEVPSGGFIRMESGQIFVFDGVMDGCYRNRGAVEVDMHTVSPFLNRELVSGIPFTSEDDLALLLEGMRAP